MKNNIDRQYQTLLQTILDFGVEKKDRTGTGTKSIFGYTIRHNMKEGFPSLTTKKLAWKQVVSELLWFLTGQTNIQFLLKYNNNIWNGDAYKNYIRKLSKVHSKHYEPMDIKSSGLLNISSICGCVPITSPLIYPLISSFTSLV